jgi:hypothetical protein
MPRLFKRITENSRLKVEANLGVKSILQITSDKMQIRRTLGINGDRFNKGWAHNINAVLKEAAA